MDINEIRLHISEMGKSAGKGLEENSKIIYQLLIVLNGSGLVASLAFIGAILSAKLATNYIPFYWCVIIFGIGILTAFFSLLSNFIYFRMAVGKYYRVYLNEDPHKLVSLTNLIAVLEALSTPTKGQKISAGFQKYLPIFSSISFLIGLVIGSIYLNELNFAFKG